MAGNRRLAGGIESAMTNLKTIDEEIAARRAAEAAAVSWPLDRLVGYARNYLGRGDVVLARGMLEAALAAEVRVDLEEGAYARAREYALDSLRASLGENHPDYVLITTTPSIGKPDAMRKYERLMDQRLKEFVTANDARRALEAGKPDETWLIAQSRAVAKVASPRELQEFALQVGGLSWPATYGSSPWERAFSFAAKLGFVLGAKPLDEREAGTSWHALDLACVAAYREERQRLEGVLGRARRRVLRCSVTAYRRRRRRPQARRRSTSIRPRLTRWADSPRSRPVGLARGSRLRGYVKDRFVDAVAN